MFVLSYINFNIVYPNYEPMNEIVIEGLDLKIDPSIQKICETSNQISKYTRYVAYVLVIVNALSLIVVANTTPGNWVETDIDKHREDIVRQKKALRDMKKGSDSYLVIEDSIEQTQIILDASTENQITNYHTVTAPLLGIVFHKNDLGLFTGLSSALLLMLMTITLERESKNLKVALVAITRRYIPTADSGTFWGKRPEELAVINRIRRQHHYDFLVMNDIFVIPPYRRQGELSWLKVLFKNIFWLPVIVYGIVLFNDLFLSRNLLHADNWRSLMSIGEYFVLGLVIAWLVGQYTRTKKEIYKLYDNFKDNDKFTYYPPVEITSK